jgi:hypothetical protein
MCVQGDHGKASGKFMKVVNKKKDGDAKKVLSEGVDWGNH